MWFDSWSRVESRCSFYFYYYLMTLVETTLSDNWDESVVDSKSNYSIPISSSWPVDLDGTRKRGRESSLTSNRLFPEVVNWNREPNGKTHLTGKKKSFFFSVNRSFLLKKNPANGIDRWIYFLVENNFSFGKFITENGNEAMLIKAEVLGDSDDNEFNIKRRKKSRRESDYVECLFPSVLYFISQVSFSLRTRENRICRWEGVSSTL